MWLGIRIDFSDYIREMLKRKCYSQLYDYYWGIRFSKLSLLRDIGVDEIIDPIVDRRISVYALYLPFIKIFDESKLDLIEKTAIIADELKTKLIVYPVTFRHLKKLKEEALLEKLFKLISSYYLKLCFNVKCNKQRINKLLNLVSDFTGGVFYFSLESLASSSKERMLEKVDSVFGLLKIIHIDGRELSFLMEKPEHLLKYYDLINHLVWRGFEGFIAIDYYNEKSQKVLSILEQRIKLAQGRRI